MVFSFYRLKIVIGIAILLMLAFVLVNQVNGTKNYYTIGGLILSIIAVTIWLFHSFDKQNRDLRNAIIHLKEGNFAYKLQRTSRNDKDFAELISQINQTIQSVRLESQSRLEYLNRVVEQVDVGLMAYTKSGTITMINPAALTILGINHIKKVEQFESLYYDLYKVIREIKPQESKVVISRINGEDKRLLVRISVFTLQDETIRLVSFQNIKEVLDRSEVESWQKLIRVLTHEITNSVTPIVTTCQGIKREIDADIEGLKEQRFSKGISIIEQRSSNLIDFVKKFRSFSLIPEIKPEWINPNVLVEGVVELFSEESKDLGVIIDFSGRMNSIELYIDLGLLQQLLINLLRNALQSLDGIKVPRIDVEMELTDNHNLVIKIIDNGCGIKPQNLDKVFIPFFTTRKEGSGIGLSFSLQIMQMHGGNISLCSNEGIGTSVKLTFPEYRVRSI